MFLLLGVITRRQCIVSIKSGQIQMIKAKLNLARISDSKIDTAEKHCKMLKLGGFRG